MEIHIQDQILIHCSHVPLKHNTRFIMNVCTHGQKYSKTQNLFDLDEMTFEILFMQQYQMIGHFYLKAFESVRIC